jgi:signal recognition particle receptor subunit beta
MASINYAAREINVKIVYYGPGLSGKTTNLQVIHKKVPPEFKSDMVSLATETDRTLFFDFLPLDLGKIKGFATKFQLYTVPGQVYYNATRKLVLRGVDGVVFVADSGQDKIEENLESFQNLEENLAEYGYKRESTPIIIQYNKRDLPNALPVEELEQYVNKYHLPWSEAVANKGIGVFDSLKLIGKIVIDYLNKKYSRGSRGASGAAPAPQAPRTMQQQQQRPQLRQPPPPPLPPRMQQPAPSPYNQLGHGQQFQPPQRPAGSPPPPPAYPQHRPPSAPMQPMQQKRNVSAMQPGQQIQQPYMQQPRQAYAPPPAAPSIPQPQHFESQQMPQAPVESYNDQVSFEPPVQHQTQAPANQPNQEEEYYSYGSINLEPMSPQQTVMPTQQETFEPSYNQQPAPRQQMDDYNVTGKTDLDMEIERYQREIEEKQKKMRTGGNPAQQAAPSGYIPSGAQEQRQPPNIPQQQVSDNVQQDYDVYNMDMQSYASPQPRPQVQPSMGGNDEEEMFFTSVDTDRQKKPVRRPVNPRTQQQKGFLSKFFNKDMS